MHRLLTAQQTGRPQALAFTRLELAAALAALALLAMLVLPALASSQSRGHVAQCLNNLRLIGRGVQLWGADYSDQPPVANTSEHGRAIAVVIVAPWQCVVRLRAHVQPTDHSAYPDLPGRRRGEAGD